MTIRRLRTTVALAAPLLLACSSKERSPREVLAQDSALASSVAFDTAAYSEAADVSMASDPDSVLPAAGGTTTPASRAVPKVGMRVERKAPPPAATPATTSPPAERAPMRPQPATIHPEPIRPPGERISPAPSPGRQDDAASAAATIGKVPGAITFARSSDACDSPAATDQRRCLMAHLARSDVTLDRNYQALIASMKREAGTPPGGREPESVQQLRAAQRAWLVYRDTECRRRNRGQEGPLWAPVRAKCLAEFSGQRAEELARALAERR